MKQVFICVFTLVFFVSCKSLINQDFEYSQTIKAEEIQNDIEFLKKDLLEVHYDIDWEDKQEEIFAGLDSIGEVKSGITLDSFENRISAILNGIDDGHSRVIHQEKYLPKVHPFGATKISNSTHYLRIANFSETDKMKETLLKFKANFEASPTENVLIDIRSNPGGNIENVTYFLSYFLPPKTKVFDRIDCKPVKRSEKINSFIINKISKAARAKSTKSQKLQAAPSIYLLVDEKIYSGSMLSSYHLQQNGAFVIGEAPSGLFNTFGNVTGRQLPGSELVYGLSALRIIIAEEAPLRNEDMLIPDYIPDEKMNLNQVIEFINQ